MFTTQGIDTDKKSKASKYLEFGGPQNLKINEITIETAKTGSKRAVFHMEGRPMNTPDWEGENGAAGRVGRVRTRYMKSDGYQDFLIDIGIIADKLGIRSKIDAIKADNFEDFISQLNQNITGKFLWFVLACEEYPKQNGTIGYALKFRKFGFVASEAEGAGHLNAFDRGNKWDYTPYVADTVDDGSPF